MDITYIAMARGFVYLAVALDWFSRRVLSWRLSITMEVAFCIETLEAPRRATANRRYSTPTRARSSLNKPSPARSPAMALSEIYAGVRLPCGWAAS